MKYCFHRFVLVLIFAVVLLSCGSCRVIPVVQADTLPLLPLTKAWRKPFPPTAKNRLRLFLYGNLRYPDNARETGVQSSFLTSYRISREGKVEDIRVKELPESVPISRGIVPYDTLIIVQFRIPLIESDHGPITQPPLPEFTRTDTLMGRMALKDEVERVLKALPDFKPARKNEKPVAVSILTIFIFRLE